MEESDLFLHVRAEIVELLLHSASKGNPEDEAPVGGTSGGEGEQLDERRDVRKEELGLQTSDAVDDGGPHEEDLILQGMREGMRT